MAPSTDESSLSAMVREAWADLDFSMAQRYSEWLVAINDCLRNRYFLARSLFLRGRFRQALAVLEESVKFKMQHHHRPHQPFSCSRINHATRRDDPRLQSISSINSMSSSGSDTLTPHPSDPSSVGSSSSSIGMARRPEGLLSRATSERSRRTGFDTTAAAASDTVSQTTTILDEARYLIAALLRKLGEYRRMLRFLVISDDERSIPKGGAGLYLSGLAYRAIGQRERAERCFRRCLHLNSRHIGAIEELAELAFDPLPDSQCFLSDEQEAHNAFHRAHPLSSGLRRVFKMDAEARYRIGKLDCDGALRLCAKLKKAMPPPGSPESTASLCSSSSSSSSSSSEEEERGQHSVAVMQQDLHQKNSSVKNNNNADGRRPRSFPATCVSSSSSFSSFSRRNNCPCVLDIEARAYFEKADYRSAAKRWIHLHLEWPGCTLGSALLSTALWHLRDLESLRDCARRSLLFDPTGSETWIAVANYASLIAQSSDKHINGVNNKNHSSSLPTTTVIRCLERAIAADPRDGYAWALRGHEYLAKSQFDLAQQSYQKALDRNDRLYSAWFGLGNVAFQNDRWSEAESRFRTALGIHPRCVVLHCSLAKSLLASGQHSHALSAVEQALKLEPNHPSALSLRARMQMSLGYLELALKDLQRLRMLLPHSWQVCSDLASVYKSLRLHDRAVQSLQRALELNAHGREHSDLRHRLDKLTHGEEGWFSDSEDEEEQEYEDDLQFRQMQANHHHHRRPSDSSLSIPGSGMVTPVTRRSSNDDVISSFPDPPMIDRDPSEAKSSGVRTPIRRPYTAMADTDARMIVSDNPVTSFDDGSLDLSPPQRLDGLFGRRNMFDIAQSSELLSPDSRLIGRMLEPSAPAQNPRQQSRFRSGGVHSRTSLLSDADLLSVGADSSFGEMRTPPVTPETERLRRVNESYSSPLPTHRRYDDSAELRLGTP